MDWLLPQGRFFIETGSNQGTTARYVAAEYPGVRVFTCEPDAEAYQHAREHLAPYPNAHLSKTGSPEFLHDIFDTIDELGIGPDVYWLDAHGYGYVWPLVDEVSFLTTTLERAFIAIDDFRIPGRPEFKFDEYDGQVCSMEAIRPALADRDYTVVYPTYSEHTSPHHPLTGITVLAFGVNDFELPEHLSRSFRAVSLDQAGDP